MERASPRHTRRALEPRRDRGPMSRVEVVVGHAAFPPSEPPERTLKPRSTHALSFLVAIVAIAATGCTKGDGAGSQKLAETKPEKVAMNGVSWEVALPVDMKKPQYKVTDP